MGRTSSPKFSSRDMKGAAQSHPRRFSPRHTPASAIERISVLGIGVRREGRRRVSSKEFPGVRLAVSRPSAWLDHSQHVQDLHQAVPRPGLAQERFQDDSQMSCFSPVFSVVIEGGSQKNQDRSEIKRVEVSENGQYHEAVDPKWWERQKYKGEYQKG